MLVHEVTSTGLVTAKRQTRSDRS